MTPSCIEITSIICIVMAVSFDGKNSRWVSSWEGELSIATQKNNTARFHNFYKWILRTTLCSYSLAVWWVGLWWVFFHITIRTYWLGVLARSIMDQCMWGLGHIGVKYSYAVSYVVDVIPSYVESVVEKEIPHKGHGPKLKSVQESITNKTWKAAQSTSTYDITKINVIYCRKTQEC